MKVTARARRSGDWWAINVPEVEGVFTQTKRLEQVAEEAADAVATMLDIDPAGVEVAVSVDLPAEVDAQVSAARMLVAEADKAQRAASSAMRGLVAMLRSSVGLSVRDVGAILGISHQRVAQLEEASGKAPAKRLEVVQGGKAATKSPKNAARKPTPVKHAAAKTAAKTVGSTREVKRSAASGGYTTRSAAARAPGTSSVAKRSGAKKK